MILADDAQVIEMLERLDQQLGTDVPKAPGQLRRILPLADRGRANGQNRPVVQLLVHLHDRHARLKVSREDRTRDGGGAAVSRQKRSVHVDRAQPGNRQHRRRKDLPVGDDDQEVGRQGA